MILANYLPYTATILASVASACTESVASSVSAASVVSVASLSSVSAASVVSVASASAAAWSSAAAVPSAACWIAADDKYGSATFEVYGINGWAGKKGSRLWNQEHGCGILSAREFHTDGVSEFKGRFRETQHAYFTLSLFKGGCVERAVHSAGGPAPGTGPGQIACQRAPSPPDSDRRISGPRLKAVQGVADGTSTSESLPDVTEDEAVRSGESSSASTEGSDEDLVASASASSALPHLLSAAKAASSAPTPTGTWESSIM